MYSTEDVNDEYITKQGANDDSKKMYLKIKEEQLDLAKKWVETGEVKIYRESFTEEKIFTIPVVHEELVIEKYTSDSNMLEHKDNHPEVIRISLSEEQVVLTKHRVTLEDVSIYKQQVEDIIHIEETLKREKAKMRISGSPRIIDQSNQEHS